MSEDNSKIFYCSSKSKLFDCILQELVYENLEVIMNDPSLPKSLVKINCIQSALMTCLKDYKDAERKNVQPPIVEFLAQKNDQNLWRIKDVNIKLDLIGSGIDEYIIKINQCLKFFKVGCKIDESVNVYSSLKDKITDFNIFKEELELLNKQIDDIIEEKLESKKLIKDLEKFE